MSKLITYEELDKHNKPDDVWIQVHGKVYQAGKIASKAFDLASHTPAVQQKMKEFLKGSIDPQTTPGQHQKQNDDTSIGQILIILAVVAAAAILYYINNSKQSL